MDRELLNKIYWLVKYIQDRGGNGPSYHVFIDKDKIDAIVPEIKKWLISQFSGRDLGGCPECDRLDSSHHSSCSQYQERH